MKRLLVFMLLGLTVSGNAYAQDEPSTEVAPPPKVNGEPNEESEQGSSLFVGAELFTGFEHRSNENDSIGEFVLDRAEITTGFDQSGFGGLYLALEVIRSAGEDSLIGIDGNSLSARLKHGFGYADPELGPGQLFVAVGLVANLWILALEDSFDFRAIRPIASERVRFFDSGELGVTATYELMKGLAELSLGFDNGEGRNEVEQNEGKNTTVVATFRPVRFTFAGDEAHLKLRGIYRDGSLGAASGRSHRFGGGVSFSHRRVAFSAEAIWAQGTPERSDVDANVLSFMASGRLLDPYLGLYGFFDRHVVDESLDDSAIVSVGGGVFTDLLGNRMRLTIRTLGEAKSQPLQRLRIYAGYGIDMFGSDAGAVPDAPEASNIHTIKIQIEARGFANLFDTTTMKRE